MEQGCRYQFRIVVIGDVMTGKTALVRCFVNDYFCPHTEPTIGIDYFLKIVNLEDDVNIRLQLWDTAGQERFRAITHAYYRNSLGVVLVYDITDRLSFLHLTDWLHDAKTFTHNVVFQLVACKCDLEDRCREVSTEEGQRFADRHQMKLIETSAKKLYNVKEAFTMMTRDILAKVRRGEIDSHRIDIDHLESLSLEKTTISPEKKECHLCQSS